MTPKLLLADDSVTIQRVIELTFADENVQVIAVGDGTQAIERIRNDRPDIVLADIGMPERDGYEVASFVKGTPELAHIPVLLLTGAFEPVDEGRARSVGCEGVLVKPFEPQMVISRVRELLAKQPAADRPPAEATGGPPAAAAAKAASPAGPPAPPSGANELDVMRPAAGVDQRRDPLEDYFDRLDAALSSMSTVPPPPMEEEPPQGELSAPYPGLEPVVPVEQEIVLNSGATLSSSSAPSSPAPDAARPAPAPQPPKTPAASGAAPQSRASVVSADPGGFDMPRSPAPLHEAFAALLAAEERRPVLPPGGEPLPDEAIESIVQRVLARLKDTEMRRLVLDAAERLVREEIDRIKSLRENA